MITRFAPSPTGDLHIGGVRTALYSYLIAKKHGGKFHLRIEDTDRERSNQSSIDVILQGLEWLNLLHDGEILYQSQRFSIYNEIIDQMIKDGLAYYCWVSPEELAAQREAQIKMGQKPKYNCKYRNGGEPVAGVTPVVRFKNPQTGVVSWNDLVRGTITIDNQELDDIIIRRSDGSPTYNFCAVVDDHKQKIQMVVRGDDHINNTPRQINLYKALNYPIPEFAHVPMILGDDGKRLSKRHGSTNVLSYRESGFLPDAVINYLARLGWAHGDQEIFNREELIKLFEISDVNSAPSAFNTEKLKWLNQQYIIKSKPNDLLNPLKEQLLKQNINTCDEQLLTVIPHYQERAKTLLEMAENISWIFKPINYQKDLIDKIKSYENIRALLLQIKDLFNEIDVFTIDNIRQEIKDFCEKNSIKLGKIGAPIRLILTGGAPSPDLAITISLLSKAETISRIEQIINLIS